MIKKRLLKLFPGSVKYVIRQVFWQWISLLCQIVMIFTMAILFYEGILEQNNSREVLFLLVIFPVAIAIRLMADRQATYASNKASSDVKELLREKIYEKLLRLGNAYRQQVTTAQVVQMAAEGVEQLETYFGNYLPQLFYSLLAPITLFVVLSFASFRASIILLICVPLIPLSIVAVQRIAKKLLQKYWGIYTELGDSFLENLQGLTTLKIYQCDEARAAQMDVESQRFRQITMKVLTMQLNSTSVMDIIAYGGAAIGMIVSLGEYAGGNISLVEAITITLLASEFFIPLRLLGSFFHIAMNGMAASDQIFALLDLPEDRMGTGKIQNDKVTIALKHVSFAYEEEREILEDIQMVFEPGTLTSLVGESGCGKSTVAGLIMGRNKDYNGKIRIEDEELSEMDETDLMNHITLVSFNSYLFKGTVEENLRMACPDATDEEMVSVLKKVNLWGYLRNQHGLKTVLTERGSNFSGGQCQRLAVARALLHDTPVYIFDEATSNIDVDSENLIMEVVYQLAKEKTVILITHRLANAAASDNIYVMDRGSVAQQGTHQSLLKDTGIYQRLYNYQEELEQYGREAVS